METTKMTIHRALSELKLIVNIIFYTIIALGVCSLFACGKNDISTPGVQPITTDTVVVTDTVIVTTTETTEGNEPTTPVAGGLSLKVSYKTQWYGPSTVTRYTFVINGPNNYIKRGTSPFSNTFYYSYLSPGQYSYRVQVTHDDDNNSDFPKVKEGAVQVMTGKTSDVFVSF